MSVGIRGAAVDLVVFASVSFEPTRGAGWYFKMYVTYDTKMGCALVKKLSCVFV